MEKRGDVLIQGLWEVQTDAIIDVIFDDADIYTYRYEPMDKILDFWEKDIIRAKNTGSWMTVQGNAVTVTV